MTFIETGGFWLRMFDLFVAFLFIFVEENHGEEVGVIGDSLLEAFLIFLFVALGAVDHFPFILFLGVSGCAEILVERFIMVDLAFRTTGFGDFVFIELAEAEDEVLWLFLYIFHGVIKFI